MGPSAEDAGCLFVGFSRAELALFAGDLVCCKSICTLDDARQTFKAGRRSTVIVHLRAFGREELNVCCGALAEAIQVPVIVVIDSEDVISSKDACQSGAAGFYSVEQLANGLYARAIRRAYRNQTCDLASKV